MGNKAAPAYANISLGHLENKFFDHKNIKFSDWLNPHLTLGAFFLVRISVAYRGC